MESIEVKPQSIQRSFKERISYKLRKKLNQKTKDVLLFLLMEDKELRNQQKSKELRIDANQGVQ